MVRRERLATQAFADVRGKFKAAQVAVTAASRMQVKLDPMTEASGEMGCKGESWGTWAMSLFVLTLFCQA